MNEPTPGTTHSPSTSTVFRRNRQSRIKCEKINQKLQKMLLSFTNKSWHQALVEDNILQLESINIKVLANRLSELFGQKQHVEFGGNDEDIQVVQ